jgi:hypothetical protein
MSAVRGLRFTLPTSASVGLDTSVTWRKQLELPPRGVQLFLVEKELALGKLGTSGAKAEVTNRLDYTTGGEGEREI